MRGGCNLVGGERKPKDPIIRPSNFTIVQVNRFVDNRSGYLSSWGNIGACGFGLVTSNADL